ncbi:transcriptional regulator [Microbispora rosea subsp. aerata]|nr:helix-turn-helix transcriptional regulator [Microbispora rosea]GGO25336.1 transcriptional regulator [Microbispora rosea subsp. aerata]GLJ85267.1 transcriptional regulator [Microbispora rosea subsp. aerata]
MTVAIPHQRPFGELLRRWREHRRMSQLDLSNQAEISTRHISFLETGRAAPSREMVLRLAEHLDLPLRERNHLLLAAGYAPVYGESPLASPQMAAVCDAIRRLLSAHDPYPAVVVDRGWNLVDANDGIGMLAEGIDPDLLSNVLRATLHPEGLAPHILNLGEWRAHLLGRLRRQITLTADPLLGELYAELRGYPCDQPEPEVELPGPGDILVPLRVRRAGRELTFFSIVATFGTPLDITVSELAIESFYPADSATAAFLRDISS